MITLDYWQNLTPYQQELLIKQYCLEAGMDNEDTQTLASNLKLVTRFSQQAHVIAQKRTHYSARTIIEVLRHNSIIEDNDPDYKINNNVTPLMARISMAMFPALNALFSIRNQTSKN